MSEKLPRQAWLTQPATVQVMDALAAEGGSDCG
jgi:hypothetical protein